MYASELKQLYQELYAAHVQKEVVLELKRDRRLMVSMVGPYLAPI